jgi:hypothetical protein
MPVESDRGTDRSPRTLATLQIVVGSLALGVMILLAVLVGLRVALGAAPPAAAGWPIFTYLGIAFVAVALLARLIVMERITVSAVRRLALSGRNTDDSTGLFEVFFMRTTIGCAIIEGMSLFLGLAYYLENQLLALILAVLGLLALAAQFPTQAGLDKWLDEQRNRLERFRAR